jgi:hypothetical protein
MAGVSDTTGGYLPTIDITPDLHRALFGYYLLVFNQFRCSTQNPIPLIS